MVCYSDFLLGLGHYRTTSTPTQIKGELQGVKINQIASTGDCVLAVFLTIIPPKGIKQGLKLNI
jgi:hypothetical protein